MIKKIFKFVLVLPFFLFLFYFFNSKKENNININNINNDISIKKINIEKIKLPEEIKKIDRIKYLNIKDKLLLIVQENDNKRALWSYSDNGFKRLIKIPHELFNAFVHIDLKNNIYFESDNPHFFYRSDDYGKNWERILSPKEIFWSIFDTGEEIYGGAWSFNSPDLYKSRDQGKIWEKWINFHEVFPEEAIQYNKEDERFKIRHLHDVLFYKENIILGLGDVTRLTVLSNDNGKSWKKIWDEGFVSHILIPKEDRVLLSSDIDGDFGIVSYSFENGDIKNVWNPSDYNWSGYIYSMLEKDNKYYASAQVENKNAKKYGIIFSPDGDNWRSILEITPEADTLYTRVFLSDGPQNKIYLSLNGKLYMFNSL